MIELQKNCKVQINNQYVHRIPLKYFCDIRNINFPTKIDRKICLMFEIEVKNLFKSKKNVENIGMLDAYWYPFLRYKQILPTKNSC